MGLVGALDFGLLSHAVGIGSAAVKYMWIIKAWTEALLTAGAAPGPKMAALEWAMTGHEAGCKNQPSKLPSPQLSKTTVLPSTTFSNYDG